MHFPQHTKECRSNALKSHWGVGIGEEEMRQGADQINERRVWGDFLGGPGAKTLCSQ